MATLAFLWKYKWVIIIGVLLIVIFILSGVVYSKNKNISKLNEEIGKLKVEIQIEQERSELLDNKLVSCLFNKETPEERDKRSQEIIEAISKKIEAENIGKGFTPELERCIRERENCLHNLEKLMEEGKYPPVDDNVEKTIYDDAIQIMNHIDKEIER